MMAKIKKGLGFGILLLLIFIVPGGLVVAWWLLRSKGLGMKLSQTGLQYIAGKEKFSANLYNDAGGHATIGYGHLVHLGPINGSEPAEFKAGITKTRAIQILLEDTAKAQAPVNKLVKVKLSQAQFDALVSFVFNIGAGAFAKSTALKALNAGQFNLVPADLSLYNKSGGVVLAGLVTRRAEEGAAFV